MKIAANHKVWMKGTVTQAMKFEPDFLKIAAGDTVTFVREAAGYRVTSVDGLSPEGAQRWRGTIDQDLTVMFCGRGFSWLPMPTPP